MATSTVGRQPAESEHYAVISKGYHGAFFYTGDYERWQLNNVLSRFLLQPAHRLVDIGGGTGRFASLIREAAGLDKVLCVDPSASMLEEAARLPGVDTVCRGGVDFALDAKIRYDRALIKEVVHHLNDTDLLTMFKGILAQLNAGGMVLVCTRPHVVDYPFFRAALEIWSRQQPPMEQYIEIMRAVGFCDVRCDVVAFPVVIDKDWWLQMVRSRFWSTFSHFSDEELAQGLDEITAKHAGNETIAFSEKMVFITARKQEELIDDRCIDCSHPVRHHAYMHPVRHHAYRTGEARGYRR